MKLRFYGADRCVTGSCHCLEVNGKHILVDCGLQQGRDEIDNTALPFHPGSIDVVLVTHAHIDHSGRIPMLIKNGFQGKIITTRLTADLLDIMLQDSAHIQEQDAEYQNRKFFFFFVGGFSLGARVLLATRLCGAKCSVLYALSALP